MGAVLSLCAYVVLSVSMTLFGVPRRRVRTMLLQQQSLRVRNETADGNESDVLRGAVASAAADAADGSNSAPKPSAVSSASAPQLLTTLDDGKTTTLAEVFQRSVRRRPAERCLGTRSTLPDGRRGAFQWRTYSEVDRAARDLGAGLLALGVRPGDRVGVYAKNRYEWVVLEQACYAYNFVIVSFYDTLGATAVEFIANHSSTAVVMCSRESWARTLRCSSGVKCLRTVIKMEALEGDDEKEAAAAGVHATSFDEVLQLGVKHPYDAAKIAADVEAKAKAGGDAGDADEPKLSSRRIPAQPNDVCTIMYTSGTTGDPKGVMMTHANLVATIAGAITFISSKKLFTADDAYLSYLPLAHILERATVSMALYYGGRIGFFQGDVRFLVDDIRELKPAVIVGVPRVFDRIYDKINATIRASPVKSYLFSLAIAAKRRALEQGLDTPLWNFFLFNKVRSHLGGNVRLIISGGAPLTASVQEFLRICFSVPVVQGYGLTETCAAATLSLPDDNSLGHVGPPTRCCEVKLVSVPEMNYTVADEPAPRGEICVRGANVALGYYRNPEKTAEDFRNGWLHSGDIGRINANGTLSVVDRKKNLFKLSQGEYIAPEKLEGVFGRSRYISQIFVYGDSTKPYCVAIVVPDPDEAQRWAAANNAGGSDVAALCRNKVFEKVIVDDMQALGKQQRLLGFEFMHGVHLTPNEFSVDAGLMTPTFKLKRPSLRTHFEAEIAQMYGRAK